MKRGCDPLVFSSYAIALGGWGGGGVVGHAQAWSKRLWATTLGVVHRGRQIHGQAPGSGVRLH